MPTVATRRGGGEWLQDAEGAIAKERDAPVPPGRAQGDGEGQARAHDRRRRGGLAARQGGGHGGGAHPRALRRRRAARRGPLLGSHRQREAAARGLPGPVRDRRAGLGRSEPLERGQASSSGSALRPELVVEIDFDHVSAGRIRHGAKLRRWREDKTRATAASSSSLRRRPARAGSIGGEDAQSPATVAEEEYLQILFWLQEAGLPMTGANLSRAMQLSAPTVHEMIVRLERDGYITRAADRSISFTDSGAEHAEGIVRRHRLIERFLTDVLGVPWDEVHEEAERLEHAMSPVLEERMLAAIGDAKTCPHGHPIVAGQRLAGRAARRRRARRLGAGAAFRERGRGPPALPEGAPASSRAWRGPSPRATTTTWSSTADGAICAHAERRRDRFRDRRSVAAAAHGAARAARPRPALRALTPPRAGYSERYASASRATPVSICSGRHPRVGEAQRVLAALEQEVGALHERHAALGGGLEERRARRCPAAASPT